MNFKTPPERRAWEKALYLLQRIRDDLDPHGFTVEEIMEEGLDAVLFVVNSTTHLSMTTLRRGRIARAINLLIAQGYIEQDDDGLMTVTEAGLDVDIK